ncbi:3893_t:CDS:2, partial [Acaulospora morrowiae]
SPANPIKDHTNLNERLSRVQYYAYNSALSIPYVSPILADDLGGLGEIFITCGGCERLRDESILFAHKAAKTHPSVFEVPRREGQRTYPPSKVCLNIFDAMPHVFQIFLFHPIAIDAINRTGDWIRKVIPESVVGDNKSDSSYESLRSYHSHRSRCSYSSYNSQRSRDGPMTPLSTNTTEEYHEEGEIDDEFSIFTEKHIDVKGVCWRTNGMDENSLKEWVNMLGKLPDFNKYPEFWEPL